MDERLVALRFDAEQVLETVLQHSFGDKRWGQRITRVAFYSADDGTEGYIIETDEMGGGSQKDLREGLTAMGWPNVLMARDLLLWPNSERVI